MKHILKYFSITILLVLVFTLSSMHKVSATNVYSNTNTITHSIKDIVTFKKLNNNYLDNSTWVITNEFEEEEEEEIDYFSEDILVTVKRKKQFIRRYINDNRFCNTDIFSSQKKRFYILYCQLKVYS